MWVSAALLWQSSNQPCATFKVPIMSDGRYDSRRFLAQDLGTKNADVGQVSPVDQSPLEILAAA
jgi:hypothetical protein